MVDWLKHLIEFTKHDFKRQYALKKAKADKIIKGERK